MRLAICLSGHTRTYKSTLDSMKSNLVDRFPGDVDIFIHTYHTCGYKLKSNKNASDESVFLTTEQIIDILKNYDPKRILIADNQQVIQNSKPEIWDKRIRVQPETNVYSVLSMFYSIEQCNGLKSAYEDQFGFKYDVVMRLRFDDLIKRQDFDFTTVQDEIIYVPTIDGLKYNAKQHGGWSWRNGLNDQLGFGTSKIMDIYSGVYSEIKIMYQNGIWFHPETMLKTHIIKNNIKPQLVDEIEFDLCRSGI